MDCEDWLMKGFMLMEENKLSEAIEWLEVIKLFAFSFLVCIAC